MGITRLLGLLYLAVAGLACLGILSGCDDDGDGARPVAISPTSATILRGATLEFTVYGGSVTAWALSRPDWGRLTIIAPNRVRYASVFTPSGYDEIQTLHADVSISEDPPRTSAVEAFITHRGALSPTTTTSTTTTTTSVTPSTTSSAGSGTTTNSSSGSGGSTGGGASSNGVPPPPSSPGGLR